MLKKTINYEDFDGNSRTEDFYFNLTKAEIAKMESSVPGGYAKMLESMIQRQDATVIMNTLERFVDDSFGVKTPDGRGFKKSAELLDDFKSTEAYSTLFMEICTSADAAASFVEGILPRDVAAAAKRKQNEIESTPKLTITE